MMRSGFILLKGTKGDVNVAVSFWVSTYLPTYTQGEGMRGKMRGVGSLRLLLVVERV